MSDHPKRRFIISDDPRTADDIPRADAFMDETDDLRELIGTPTLNRATVLPESGDILFAQSFADGPGRYFVIGSKSRVGAGDVTGNEVLRRIGGTLPHTPEEEETGQTDCGLRLVFRRGAFTEKAEGKNVFNFSRDGHIKAHIWHIEKYMDRPDQMDSGGDKKHNNYTISDISLDRYRQGCFLVSVGTTYGGGNDSLNLMEGESKLMLYFDGKHGSQNITSEVGSGGLVVKELARLDVRTYSGETGTPLSASQPVTSSSGDTSASLRLNRDYDYMKITGKLSDFDFDAKNWDISFSFSVDEFIDKTDSAILMSRAGRWRFLLDSGGYLSFQVYDVEKTITGGIKKGEAAITGLSAKDFASANVNDAVSGAGLADGTTILSKVGNDGLTISQPATSTVKRGSFAIGDVTKYTWKTFLKKPDPLDFHTEYNVKLSHDATDTKYTLAVNGNEAASLTGSSVLVFKESDTVWLTIGAELDTDNKNPECFWRGNIGGIIIRREQDEEMTAVLDMDCAISLDDNSHNHTAEAVNRAKIADGNDGFDSIRLNRDYDCVTVSASSDWGMATGFMLETLIFPTRLPPKLTDAEKNSGRSERLAVITSVSGKWKLALNSEGDIGVYDDGGGLVSKPVNEDGAGVGISTNTFTRVAISVDGAAIKWKINGVALSTGEGSSVPSSGAGELVIGAEIVDNRTENGFCGNIDSFSVFRY